MHAVPATALARQRTEIRQLTGALGAELTNVDLSRPLDAESTALIERALDEHLVLFFRRQHLSPSRLRELVASFGPVFVHPIEVSPFAEAPGVLELRKEPGGKLFGGSNWHSDVTWQEPVGHVSVLHGLEIPSFGNDTVFASLMVAFEALSIGMQSMLRQLRAVHAFHLLVAGEKEHQSAIHPVVRRHPVTGREGIYLNRLFVRQFEGMTVDESRPLLDFLFAHLVRHDFTCRFRWEPGSVAMWDNRFTLHLPINDATAERRVMIRATALESAATQQKQFGQLPVREEGR